MSESFVPAFCPYPECRSSAWSYQRHGTHVSRGQVVPRFRCKGCRRTFSKCAFEFSFRFKHRSPNLSAKILRTFILGSSNRQIAHHLFVSEKCVRGRLERMAQWAMKRHCSFLQDLQTIDEAVCYDGLENFAGSQYDPNYINQVIGQDSLFIYDYNFAPLNRKGRMSERQKLREKDLRKTHGRYPVHAVRSATTVLLSRLKTLQKSNRPLVLCSDEHFQYRRALRFDLKPYDFLHQTVSAKATRNYQNILFAVNHADLMIRQRVAAFSRETISFAKTHARMCQKYALFMVHKNYLSPQFTKRQVRRPRAHVESPAQSLGLTSKILSFHEFFSERSTWTAAEVPSEWKMIMNNQVPYARTLVARALHAKA